MKYKEWSFVDKSEWKDGEWNNEPDKVQWLDEETKMPCLAKRHPSLGHWCGYIGIGNKHALFGIGYGECPIRCGKSFDCEHRPDMNLDVHGGITYAALCESDNRELGICHIADEGEEEPLWWFGFDCAHAWDYSPYKSIYEKRNSIFKQMDEEIYRNLNYIKIQCNRLAKQLLEYNG